MGAIEPRRIFAFLPAVAIIAALTAWAVVDRPTRPYRSPRAAVALRCAEALSAFLADAGTTFQEHYGRSYPRIRGRLAATGLDGERLQAALDQDPEMVALRQFDAGLRLFRKAGDLIRVELDACGKKLLDAASPNDEKEIWAEHSHVWIRLAPQARAVGTFNERLAVIGVEPLATVAPLVAALEALLAVEEER